MTRGWDRRAVDALVERGLALGPDAPGFDAYRGDVVMEGHPDALARPHGEAEVAEILAHAHAEELPVTFAGGRTSLTGASAAEEGLVVALENMDRILDLGRDPETGGMVAVAEPGIYL